MACSKLKLHSHVSNLLSLVRQFFRAPSRLQGIRCWALHIQAKVIRSVSILSVKYGGFHFLSDDKPPTCDNLIPPFSGAWLFHSGLYEPPIDGDCRPMTEKHSNLGVDSLSFWQKRRQLFEQTCIIHQYVTVSIRSRHLKIAIWKIAIHPNSPTSKKRRERKSALIAR